MNHVTTELPLAAADQIRHEARRQRLRARSGELQAPTTGLAPGAVQGNLAILPKDWAEDFMRFCHLNQNPCPLLTASRPGEYMLDELGHDIDIRTDIPLYRIFKDGTLVDEASDIRDLWQDDMVAFLLGCSYSFEEALASAGLSLRHWERGSDVAMFRTNIQTAPSGPYRGPMVVSMRPFKPADAIRAIQITSRFPRVHGAPVHFGDPAAIGIADINKPDYGEPVPVYEGEVPVFWACGVTPQSVIEHAKPPICITHRPGHMLITDLLNAELASF